MPTGGWLCQQGHYIAHVCTVFAQCCHCWTANVGWTFRCPWLDYLVFTGDPTAATMPVNAKIVKPQTAKGLANMVAQLTTILSTVAHA